jgi:hypothetical protein
MNQNYSDHSTDFAFNAQAGNGRRPPPARTFKIRFVKLPIHVLEKVISATGSAELAILTELYERHFSDYGQNPVILSSSALSKKYRIGRAQKHRALAKLQAAGVISVQTQPNRNPLVTLNWLPLQK